MLSMTKFRLWAAVTMLLVSLAAGAAPATYRFTGDIVGTLNGAPVSGLLTLNVTGDTNDITHSSAPYFLNTIGGATFDLASVGNFTVTNSAYVFSRPDLGWVGFGVEGIPICCDIIQIRNPAAFAGYDLQDDIGPIAAPPNPSLAAWFNVPTSAGLFTVTAMSNNTFQAIIAATVPEPGLPSMLALALAAAWFAGRRRNPAALAGTGSLA